MYTLGPHFIVYPTTSALPCRQPDTVAGTVLSGTKTEHAVCVYVQYTGRYVALRSAAIC
jgi:hypothetical protein